MKTTMISVALDFSRYPAGRYIRDGRYSGELFRNRHLIPALEMSDTVEVELDGVVGYGSSFLEEAFGGLIRAGIPAQDVKSRLRLVSDQPALIDEVQYFISEAITARDGEAAIG